MNISTAVSAIGSAFGTVGKLAVSALPAFAPLIAQAINRPRTTGGAYGAQPYGGALPMNIGTSLIPTGITGIAPSLPGLGAAAGLGLGAYGLTQALGLGGNGGTCIQAYQAPGRMMLPRTVNVPHPSMPGVIETYVKAPRVKYRVSVSRAGGRRCSGGR